MSQTVRVDSMRPLPASPSMNEEAVNRYETMFKEHATHWQEILERNSERMKRGSYSLHWMNTEKAAWDRRANPSSRALTHTDINNVAGYGTIPDKATCLNFAPRGSVRDQYADEMPIVDDFTLVDRDESWADNVITLYEEAKARQWNATRDIPWSELERLPDDLEKATCQLATFLTEVEFVAGDFPAKWLYKIPQDFLEVKSFIVTQMMDEARQLFAALDEYREGRMGPAREAVVARTYFHRHQQCLRLRHDSRQGHLYELRAARFGARPVRGRDARRR